MARKQIGSIEQREPTGICTELVETLESLFQEMRKHRINFEFLNIRHDKPYVGEPVPFVLLSTQLTGVKTEKGVALIQSNDAIFRIYETRKDVITAKLEALLTWAKNQLSKIVDELANGIKTIAAPASIVFFSAPVQVPRRQVPYRYS
jgi:hypothetical protein